MAVLRAYGITGTAMLVVCRNCMESAVSRQYDLFDSGGVDRWPCDREDVP